MRAGPDGRGDSPAPVRAGPFLYGLEAPFRGRSRLRLGCEARSSRAGVLKAERLRSNSKWRNFDQATASAVINLVFFKALCVNLVDSLACTVCRSRHDRLIPT